MSLVVEISGGQIHVNSVALYIDSNTPHLVYPLQTGERVFDGTDFVFRWNVANSPSPEVLTEVGRSDISYVVECRTDDRTIWKLELPRQDLEPKPIFHSTERQVRIASMEHIRILEMLFKYVECSLKTLSPT